MEEPRVQDCLGQRVHYNFVEPDHALQGESPAHFAGIRIGTQNEWLELLKTGLATSEGTGRMAGS